MVGYPGEAKARRGFWRLLLFTLFSPAPSLALSTSPSSCTWSAHGSPYPLLALATGTCAAPVGPQAPWSHPPDCPDPANKDIGGDVPDSCVFTYATFRGNQGVSLVTSPDIAGALGPSLDDSAMPPSLRDHPSSFGGGPGHGEKAYVIQDLPGRGKGIVARRRIAKHETLMVAFPVLVANLDFLNLRHGAKRFSTRQRVDMLRRGVDQLPPASAAEIAGLAQSTTKGEMIRDVINTNAFMVDLEGVEHMLLLLEGSRLNHNCRPNVFWRYSNRYMAMEVVAMRDIRPGEEVAHSYTPLGYTYAERQEMLKRWGFRCRCSLCSGSAQQRAVSDNRRERLFEIHATLTAAASESSLSRERVDVLVREAISLIEAEDIDPQLVEYYQLFARSYMSIGGLKQARMYIELAEVKWTLYEGVEHSNVEGIKKLWQELRELEEEYEDDDEED